jgi:hypothetical protein
MPPNPWLAIDAATQPLAHARRLRQAWERFLGDGELTAVRAPIADSWQRSHEAGIDPSGTRLAPLVTDADDTSARWEVHPLAAAAPLVRECLAATAEDSGHLIVVSDADGMLLWIHGDPRVRREAADSMNFTEGALWSERGAGTNAVGVALAADHAVQVFAAEHFNEVVQGWTCSAAPVHDPDDGRLLGVIDLTGLLSTAHPCGLALAMTTAQAVEAHLRCELHERDARLRSRHGERISGAGDRRALASPSGRVLLQHPGGWLPTERLGLPAGGGELVLPSGAHAFAEPVGHGEAFVVRADQGVRAARRRPLLKLCLLGRDRAEVIVDGRAVKLTRRQTEILALLSARPAGMSSEELAAALYGDSGQPSTVRVQVFRLRKLLGQCIETEPYRLCADVECDAARVEGLLDRGAVREAAERYEGQLLPRSEAPGVVRERDALDAWLRQAVMTADDDEALWAWVQSPSGGEDLAAWKRLLAGLDFRDPRRSLAAARVGALRDAYATG